MRINVLNSVTQLFSISVHRFSGNRVKKNLFGVPIVKRSHWTVCGLVVVALVDAGLLSAQEDLFRKPSFHDHQTAEQLSSLPPGGIVGVSSRDQNELGPPVAFSRDDEKGAVSPSRSQLPHLQLPSLQPIDRNSLPITGRSIGYLRPAESTDPSQHIANRRDDQPAWGELIFPAEGPGSWGGMNAQDDQYEEIVPETMPQSSRPKMNFEQLQDLQDGGGGVREVIIQRYPNGNPQIERQVIQDEQGNFLNDGYWRVYSQSGNQDVIAAGNYRRGKMHGMWMRKHAKESSPLFQTVPFSLFEGPFISIAMFQDNRLEGMWTIMDEGERKIFEMPYQAGTRNGTASWFYPSLNKMREVTFRDGLIHGRLREWDEQKKLTRDEEFIEGRRLIRNVTYYRPQQAESETYFLEGQMQTLGTDNWWQAQPARMTTEGQRVQHGPINLWHDNGLPKMKGEYANGVRVGKFTWWHPSGTKQSEGVYQEGKKNGRWTWWHANGMKSSEGLFDDDSPTDSWTWWDQEGKVIERRTFGEAQQTEEIFPDPFDLQETSIPPTIPPTSPPSSANQSEEKSVIIPQERQPLRLDEMEDIEPAIQPQNNLNPVPPTSNNGKLNQGGDPFGIPFSMFDE